MKLIRYTNEKEKNELNKIYMRGRERMWSDYCKCRVYYANE